MTYKVKLNTKPHILMADWCYENCIGKWNGTDNPSKPWNFELENDALAFKLIWI